MKKTILLKLVLLLVVSPSAPAATRLVPSDDYPTIQAAIDDCVDGDEVVVADGTYTGPGNRKIILRSNTAITIKSANGPKNCVIDCEGKSPAFLVYNRKKGRPVIDGFTITGGNAGNYDIGGAIRAYMGGVDIINCVFTNNKAKYGGAIGFDAHSVGTVTNCYISGNSADYNGAGISCSYGCRVTVSNCVITGNKSLSGAAVDCYYYSEVDVINSTIVGNMNYYAKRYGALHCKSNSTLNAVNCIIWDNLPLQVSTAYVSDSPYMTDNAVYLSNNDIQGGRSGVYDPHDWVEWGPGNIDSDPCFTLPPYQNAKGGWVDGNYHLLPSSPCVDAGINNPPIDLPANDFDGDNRVLDGDGDVVAIVDIGADEVNPESPILAVTPAGLEFVSLNEDPNPAPQILSIWNAGGGIVDWEIAGDCNWLEVSAMSGQSSGQVNEVVVSVDLDGLDIGGYNCFLSICDPNAVNSPVMVQVVLRIGDVLHVPERFATIKAAVDVAVKGHEVLVADGIYTGEGNKNIDFNGKAIIVRSENGPNNCMIDCQNSGRAFYFHSGERVSSLVEGFTITNGDAECGGAICCKESSPTIANCIIKDNSAEYGGGIYGSRSSNLIITNCTVSGNLVGRYGGGIYFVYSNPTITNCTISWNKAKGRRASGGGIYHRGSCPVIRNCTISRNTAEGYWRGESRWEKGDSGGGIYCGDGDNNTRITDCVISGNSTERTGGGIHCKRQKGDSTFAITNCIISGNTAGESGGGIQCTWESNPTITNCSITGNKTDGEQGGGIHCSDYSSPLVTNCTISGNSADEGGGIYCYWGSYIAVRNCIIWGNQAQDGSEIYLRRDSNVWTAHTDLPSGEHSVYVGPDSALNLGPGNIETDPCFVEPGCWADVNDPNIIVEPNDPNAVWVEGDYHLLISSPCINAGDPNYIAEPNEIDLDGLPRVIAGRIDMGAYEFNHIPVADAGPNQTIYAWIDGIAEVTLDGSGSYDPDGQPLTYLWSWTIDGNTITEISSDGDGIINFLDFAVFAAQYPRIENPLLRLSILAQAWLTTPASPNWNPQCDIGPTGAIVTIELPMGQHVIELIVNDGIDDSEPDYVNVNVVGALKADMWIVPKVINRHAHLKKITAIVKLPEWISRDDIDEEVKLMLYPAGVETEGIAAMRQYILGGRGRRRRNVRVIAFFDKDKFTDAVPEDGNVKVYVTGRLKSGQYFYGSDTVRIIKPRRRSWRRWWHHH